MKRKSRSTACADLAGHLAQLPVGPIADPGDLIELLADAWDGLVGADHTRMDAGKLRRIESASWNGSVLTFDIERHGALVLGSTRADVHTWEIDPRARTMRVVRERRRQLKTQDKRLDVKPLAAEIARIIVEGRKDRRVVVAKNGTVRVDIADIIPATVKWTTSSRRKRFRQHLAVLLAAAGWEEASMNRYRRAMAQGEGAVPHSQEEQSPGDQSPSR